MTCPTCGTANPAGQRFCGECGTKLASACPSCGAINAPGQRFCGDCGTQLGSTAGRPTAPAATSPDVAGTSAGPVAERKLVTVLFADLVGFTPFAEERDTEDVREVLSRYFDLASEVVLRYGGTVEKFIGDAVMAVWGTPTAREDDAERAVRAGLDLVGSIPSLGPGIAARVGIQTGEAAVTLGAANQGMVAGDIVNTAARIQSVAPTGTVLVGEATQRSASAAIAFEPVGEQSLKGKSAPVPVWRALRVVAERGGRGRSDALEAPFTGRDEELRLLKELFHGTARDNRTRLVSVTGIAGIGKSRLAWEFSKYLDGLVQSVWWHHGRSPAYDQGLTFWALGEMVRGRCGLVEGDDAATTRARVAETVATHVPDEAERPWIEASLLALLGIEGATVDGRAANPEELFAGWRTFFERLAATGPVVMSFEDLHWADGGTLDFIDHLLDWAKSIPLYIVTLARPELLERRPDWGAGRRNFMGMSLEPLSEADMRTLIGGLIPGLPERAVTAIVQRADGIPLYAVETVRMLVSEHRLEERDGVYVPTGDLTDLAVPDTLTALIAARLDALEPADRSLLLDAAVLGQSFTPAALAAVSGVEVGSLEARLRGLVRREILVPAADPRSPERGQYAFVQALIREVAYNTLAKRDRRDRHLAAARYFESIGSDELAGALAGHYLAAHALATEGAEADALAAQARIALRGAAERAAGLGSTAQAVRFLEQALSVTSDPVDQAELLERAGELASLASDHDGAIHHLERALELVKARGDDRLILRVSAALATVMLNGKRLDQVLAFLGTTSIPEAQVGTPEAAALENQRARATYFQEQPREAIVIIDRVLETAEHLDLIPLLADALVTKGSALGNLGRIREGLALIDAGRAVAEAAGLSSVVLRALNNAASQQSGSDTRAALETAKAGLAMGRRLGQQAWAISFTANLSFFAFVTGEWDLATDELQAVMADAEDPADRALLVNNLLNIEHCRGGETRALQADLAAIVAALPEATWSALQLECDGWGAFARGDHATAHDSWARQVDVAPSGAVWALVPTIRAALMAGDASGASRAIERFETQGIHGVVADAWRTEFRAGIAGLEGRRAEALTGYREANRQWRAADLPLDGALTALHMLRVLGPTEPDAVQAGEAARKTLERLRAAPLLTQLEELMAGAADRQTAGSGRSASSRVADPGAASPT